jgi:outer membrane receptor protein involved in Fe transport
LQYAADIADFGNLRGRLDVAWTDTIYNDVWNGKVPGMGASTQPGYWIVSAQLGWTSPNKRYSVEAFGDNLTDSRYFSNRLTTNTPSMMYISSGQLGAPRTYGVRLKVRFGPGVF